MRVAIIGAGAAGCFCAIRLKRLLPDAEVDVYEAGRTPLAKVAITGGGRCNLTNSFEDIKDLSAAYPRGHRLMNRALAAFSQEDTWQWFENEGIALVLQADRCVFPASQDAMQIVHTLTGLMRRLGVRVHCGCRALSIREGYTIELATKDGQSTVEADAVVVTTGGSPKRSGLSMLEPLGLEIEEPVPSLFTLNIPGQGLTEMMGAVVEDASVRLIGTKFAAAGPLLVTHWGASGPAILKLSSYGARHLAERQYIAQIAINWLGEAGEEDAKRLLSSLEEPSRKLALTHPESLSSRLWKHVIQRAGLREDIRWSELGSKGRNRLAATLISDIYDVRGKGHFKEEFVTCGGVALSNISLNTLEAKAHPGLYFAGEVLDVDAITGGFNLQAAWSMGWVVANSIATKEQHQ